MKKILFLAVHPHLALSRTHRVFTEKVRVIAGLTLHNLYDLYPYFDIHAGQERTRLIEADLIVIQFPLTWFGPPALLKQWQDDVLLESWLHSRQEGCRVRGKHILLSVTTPELAQDFSSEGLHRGSLEDFLRPWKQTALQCGLNWHDPLIFYDSLKATPEQIALHAEQLRDRLLRFQQVAEVQA